MKVTNEEIKRARELAVVKAVRDAMNCASRVKPYNVMQALVDNALTPDELYNFEISNYSIVRYFEIICESNRINLLVEKRANEVEEMLHDLKRAA